MYIAASHLWENSSKVVGCFVAANLRKPVLQGTQPFRLINARSKYDNERESVHKRTMYQYAADLHTNILGYVYKCDWLCMFPMHFLLDNLWWKLFELDVTLLIVFNQTNGHLCTHLLYKSTTSSPKIRCINYYLCRVLFSDKYKSFHESSHQFFLFLHLFCCSS